MEGDDPVVAAVESLGERILEQTQTIYRLTQEVERLRQVELAVASAVQTRRAVASVLAAVTWAESLEDAQQIASAALRGEYGHGTSPPSDHGDISSISDTEPGSKDDREQ